MKGIMNLNNIDNVKRVKRKNEFYYKRIVTLLDNYCDDDEKAYELQIELDDIASEVDACLRNLEKYISTHTTIFFNEVKILENEKLYSDLKILLSDFLVGRELNEYFNALKKLYESTSDNQSDDVDKLKDVIKKHKPFNKKIKELIKLRSENEQSTI